MAAYISVPRDLTKVKSKIIFNLTKRQLLCFSVAAVIGIPSFFLLKRTGNVSLATLGMMLVMLPFFFLALYEKDGQPLEQLGKHFIEAVIIRPKIRPYQTDNYYEVLKRQAYVEREVNRIVSISEERREKEQKVKASRRA